VMEGRRIALVRRGTEIVVTPRRLRTSCGRAVLDAVHPTTGDLLEFQLDEVADCEVLQGAGNRRGSQQRDGCPARTEPGLHRWWPFTPTRAAWATAAREPIPAARACWWSTSGPTGSS